MMPAHLSCYGCHARDDNHGEKGVPLVAHGPPFWLVAGGFASAYHGVGDSGIEAGGGEGERVEEVKDLNGGVGAEVAVDFDAEEWGRVGGKADAVGGCGGLRDAEVVMLHVGEGDGLDGACEVLPGLGHGGRELVVDRGGGRGDGACGGWCEGAGGGAGLGRGDAVWRVAW